MGNEFRVNGFTPDRQSTPDVTRFADGSFIITWDSFLSDLSLYFISSQRFDANGLRIGDETVLSASSAGDERDARVATLSNGGFVTAFTLSVPDFLGDDFVHVKAFNPDGTARTLDIAVSPGTFLDADVANVVGIANGGFMVFFNGDRGRDGTLDFFDVYAQRYTAAGRPLGGNIRVNTNVHEFDQGAVEIATLANGNFIAIWFSEASFPRPGALSDSNEIRATLYSRAGIAIRSDFSLSEAFGSAGVRHRGADVVALADGGFVVTTFDVGIDGPTTLQYNLQFFNARGDATSPIVAGISTTEGTVSSPSLTQLDTGEILLVWAQPNEDFVTFFEDVRGRLFDASGRALSNVFQLAQNHFGDQERPEATALAGGGFVVTWQSEDIDGDSTGISARIFGRGTTGNDVAVVDATGVFAGLAGNDRITGNAFRNALHGGADSDVLDGLGGLDLLNGGAGADVFRFTSLLDARRNVDRIADFTHAVDTITLARPVFANLGAALDAGEFRLGATAADANDYIVYNSATGQLYYDADGNGAGGQILFAVLDNRAGLAVEDFGIV